MEEEIYLGDYLRVLKKRWKVIVAVLSASVAISLLLGFYLIKPVYEATVGLVLLRTRAEVAFEPKIKSLEELPSIKTLESLAKSPGIVKEALGRSGLEGTLDPYEVLGAIKVRSDGEFLTVSVRHRDPAVAQQLANAMGLALEEEANALFVQEVDELEGELQKARERYEEAQRRYNQFLAKSPLPFYLEELRLKEGLLSDLYQAGRRVERVLNDLEAFQGRLDGKGAASQGDVLSEAVLNLYASTAFQRYEAPLPVSLEVRAEGGSAPELSSSVLALRRELEGKRAKLKGWREDPRLREEILSLRERIEREQALERELKEARDIAWESVKVLSRKIEELRLASKLKERKVRLASPAVRPTEPVIPKPKLYLAIGAVLGLFVGVILAFLLEALREPGGEAS